MDNPINRRRFLELSAGATALAASAGALSPLLAPTAQAASAVTYAPAATQRVRTVINGSWQFILKDVSGAQNPTFNDASWQKVNLPHSFDTPYYQILTWYQGYGWYRRHITLTAAQVSSRRISLEFEAAFQDAQVYVNGTLLGEHIGGFTGFTFDITSVAKEGDNVVAVRLNNNWNAQLAPRAGDYHFSGGITRDVYLVVTNPLHVTWYGTYVTTPQVSTTQATVSVQTEVKNESIVTKQVTLTTTIVDASNAVVQTLTTTSSLTAGATHTFAQSTTVANPHLWSPETPYLYSIASSVQDGTTAVDSYQTPFGIRSVTWSASQGFFLNGKHRYFDGADVHQDIVGWSDGATNADYYRKAQLMKQAGFQAIRESHYPHDVAFDAACDQLGLLVWSELCYWGAPFTTTEKPDWKQSAYPTLSKDWVPFENNLKQILTEMIRERRNHPSIITWSMGNEIFFTEGFDGSKTGGTGGTVMDRARALVRTLATLAESLDPSRLAGVGGAQRMGFDHFADIAGYNGDGATLSQFQNPGFPNVVTEYHATGQTYATVQNPTASAWRSGQILWEGFDHASLISGAGFDGLIDYWGRPRQLWYEYRKHYFGTGYTLPSAGTAARLALTSDKATILGDGTDSAVISAQVQNSAGTNLSNNPNVTLTITSGPGAFPTGKSVTFGSSFSDKMFNGLARITFRSYVAGTTTITASSSGLTSATLKITTTQPALAANTYYTIVNRNSGKVLDVTNGA
ncbi:MAG TPA: glycoside hydrolase family 2 TIM barrel-domain containing protein, partial [Ktedonobacteraceae bacterium]